MRALAAEPGDRFATSLEMAEALEACGPVASPVEVGAWVTRIAGELLAERAARIAAVEARLVTGIRDSIALITASDARVTRLEGVSPTPVYEGAPTSPVYAGNTFPPPPVTMLTPTLRAVAPPAEPPPAPPPAKTFSSAPPPALDQPPPPSSSSSTALPTVRNEAHGGRDSAALWTGMAALGAVAIAATLVVIIFASVPSTATPAGAPSSEPPSSAEAPAPAPPPAEPSVTAEPSAAAAPSATQAPSSPPRARVPAAPPSPPPSPRHPAGDACSPPFTLDAAGHKHYKRECLR